MEQALEWQVTAACGAVVRLEAWLSSKQLGRWPLGKRFWGSPERCGGVVEVAAVHGGYLSTGSRSAGSFIKTTGRQLPWAEAEAESGVLWPDVELSHDEAIRCVSARWRVVFTGGAVAIRESPSRKSRAVGAVSWDQLVVGYPVEDGWLASLGPYQGFVRTRTIEHGTLLRRDEPPYEDTFEVSTSGVSLLLRTTNTAGEIMNMLRRRLPIVGPARLEAWAYGRRVPAHDEATAFELGIRRGPGSCLQELQWSCDEPFDPDLPIDVRIDDDTTIAVAASTPIGVVITRLCEAYPTLQDEFVILLSEPIVKAKHVLEDGISAWEAGLRHTSRLHFVYLGDPSHDLGLAVTAHRNSSQDHGQLAAASSQPATTPSSAPPCDVAELKRRGDAAFRRGDFDTSVMEYTRCLAAGGGVAARANRAAAYKQLGDHEAVVRDCDLVLEIRHHDVKTLLRRANALEALEDYEGALADVESVLAARRTPSGAADVGDKNAALCQLSRQRLQRNVQDQTRPARRRRAESRQAHLESNGRDAAAARAVLDTVALAIDDVHCVVHGSVQEENVEHESTLIWLCEPGLDAAGVRAVADKLAKPLRRECPRLRVVVAGPPARKRLSSNLEWFDLDRADWSAYIAGKHDRPRAFKLLKAQIEESVDWVKRLVTREISFVTSASLLAIGGRDEGAVVAAHVAASCVSEKDDPLGALLMLNGPTPLAHHLVTTLETAAAEHLRVWTLNGSHHDIFSVDLCGSHNKVLCQHFRSFTSQVIPYGDARATDLDFAYVTAILSLALGRHRDHPNPPDLEQLVNDQRSRQTEPPPLPGAARKYPPTPIVRAREPSHTSKRHSLRCRCIECLQRRERDAVVLAQREELAA